MRIAADVSAATIIKTHSILSPARFGAHLHCFRIEIKITSPQFNRFGIGLIAWDYPSAVAGCLSMNPIVQAPYKTVDQRLDIKFISFTCSESCKDDFAKICFAIVVGIFEIKNIGRGSDENSAVIADHTGGPW